MAALTTTQTRIYDVSLTPNPVNTGDSFIISVTIVDNYYLNRNFTHQQLSQYTHQQLKDMGVEIVETNVTELL